MAKNALHKVVALAADYVTDHKGQWGHGEWEGFLKQVAELGFTINDDTKRHLGNILEASKQLYPAAEAMAPEKKKAPAKAKAKK